MKKKPIKGRNTQSNKKFALAAGLLAIMGFMWARVLIKNDVGPEQAKAETMEQLQQIENREKQVSISYRKLPFTAGRHDRLANDIFGPRSWYEAPRPEQAEAVVTVEQPSKQQLQQDLIRRVASDIKIEAIIIGQNGSKSEAFVNNNLVSVGSSFSVSHEGKEYAFTVIEISKENVLVKWNEFKLAIGMSQPDGLE